MRLGAPPQTRRCGPAATGLTALALVACAAADPEADLVPPEYLSQEVRLVDAELAEVRVRLITNGIPSAAGLHADCVAAQYAAIRDLGFVQRVTLTETRVGEVTSALAVYRFTEALPVGPAVIDAEMLLAACASQGIPMV